MNTIRLNTIGDSPVVVKKGSQVQSQEKTVEITENGTTEVVPDAGFSLSKVTISTNVAGGGAGNAEPEFLYTNANMLQGGLGALMQQYAVWVKLTDGNNIVICSALLMTTSYSSYTPIAFALALNTRAINKNNDEDVTLNSLINSGSIDLSSFEITKEQFYNLEA